MKYVSQMHDFQISPVVKGIILTNAFIWFVLVFVVQGLFFDNNYVFYFLGLIPSKVFDSFWFWQVGTYMFVHSTGVFHLLFNMFALWMFGSELERLWGSKFFMLYYLICGLGAGGIYLLCLKLALLFNMTSPMNLSIPMIGASGAVFGILFAYGLIFSERVILFMLVFPMKAMHFTLLIGMIEFISLVNSGIGSSISHLAHLSGFVTGFIFLQSWKTLQNFKIHKWRKRPVRLKVLKKNDGRFY